MCENCWREHGSPQLDGPQIRKAVSLIKAVYSYHPTGGALHIVLDDWNLEDKDIAFAKRYVADYAKRGQREAELACFEHFCELSIAERASALAMYNGFFE